MSRRRALLVIATGVVLAACGSGPSGPTDIPGVVTTAPGSTASGSAQAPGGSADVVATSSATAGPGEVSIAHLVAIIEQQYGSPVTVTCPQSGTIQSTPGQQFQCTFTDAHGKAGRLTVTIESTGGAFKWTIP